MSKDQFIEQYVASFLAAYTAKRFVDACMRGEQVSLENPPIGDAMYLAEKAWEKLNEFNFQNFSKRS